MRNKSSSELPASFKGPDQVNWICKPFSQLEPTELYQVLRLRSEVLVVEQNCPYLDEDNRDQESWHLMGFAGDVLVAYCRILPPGLGFSELSIGRVVSSPLVRRKGIGRPLMLNAIRKAWEIYGRQDIRIGAQFYLVDFYASVGFSREGEIYLEDDIEHVEMCLKA